MKSKIITFVFVVYSWLSVICEAQWQTDVRMTNDTSESRTSFNNAWCVAASADIVHVIWFDFRNGNPEIYYKRSTDYGFNWGPDTRLSNNPANSRLPTISVSGSVVHVVWEDDRDGNNEIYYKRSTDAGISWDAETRMTYDFAYSVAASLSVSGSVVHIVWLDTRDGQAEIYYKRSTDGGTSWGADTRLTNSYGDSWGSSVSVSGSVVHVVWHDNRDGNWEIYYKRNPAGNPIGIKPIGSEVPNDFRLYQNYPNPFNPSTTIKFDIPKRNSVKLSVFDVLGREVSNLINEVLPPGQYKVVWDGSPFPSGVYYYRLAADRQIMSGKMILIK